MLEVSKIEYASGWVVKIKGRSDDGYWTTDATIPALSEAKADALALSIVLTINEHNENEEAFIGCTHDWEEGFSMNGPTLTCKKCGEFRRD